MAHLAAARPGLVVEFGSAFGISGMWWLAGLGRAGGGHLIGFEPNVAWAAVAEENFARVGGSYQLQRTTFEEGIADVLSPGQKIDICFIDAIHTSAFVLPQFDLVATLGRPGTIVLLDDIGFSADMRACWSAVATDTRVAASFAVSHRLGVVELR